jgi:hypothetical protein
MAGSSDKASKPAAALVEPDKLTPDQEVEHRRNELEARNVFKQNKVAQVLSECRYYIEGQSFPFLIYRGTPMSVSEYYPEKKIAIDKFYHVDEWEKAITDFKLKVFKENGIKYAFLTPEKSLADLYVELGL